MRGEVVEVQPAEDLAAVLTEEGQYTVIELLECECEVGDLVSWDGKYPLEYETIRNLTGRCEMDVYFRGHGLPESQMRAALLLSMD